MSIKRFFPEIRPTLDLNFAATKRLDPRITYTRASTGTFVGLNGLIQSAAVNQARFEHNPTTGESLGLLVEEARTNLLTYSEQLDNAVWRKVNITATANAGLAPDGTTTAELLTTASTTAVKYFDPLPPPVLQTSSDYCVSFFVKLISGTGEAALVSINSSNGAISPSYASYALRLDNFAESTGGTLPSGRGYTIFPNGWVRMYMVFNTSTQTNANIEFRFGTNNTVSSYHVWGLQFEAGPFPTSYIPTTTSTVTRATDVASITGANFNSWYNQAGGTVFAEYAVVPSGPQTQIFAFETNGYALRHGATVSANLELDFAVSLGAAFGGLGLPKNKFAGRFRAGDYTSTINGSTPVTNTYAGAPNAIATTTSLALGTGLVPNLFVSIPLRINAPIAKFTYWQAFLSNATLLALSTL